MPDASDSAANPYAPPSAAPKKAPAAVAYRLVQGGLAAYALFELASIPIVWRTHQLLELSSELGSVGVGGDLQSAQAADRAFNAMAGIFYGLRAIAEIGMVLAFVAGLVWLYKVWASVARRRKRPTMRPGAVVLWCLVPLYGYWRVFGFLTELARRNRVSEDAAGIRRWWFVTAAYLLLHAFVTQFPRLGAPEIADSLLAAASALLGMRMVAALQRGQADHARSL
jgi:hypothetical protein